MIRRRQDQEPTSPPKGQTWEDGKWVRMQSLRTDYEEGYYFWTWNRHDGQAVHEGAGCGTVAVAGILTCLCGAMARLMV